MNTSNELFANFIPLDDYTPNAPYLSEETLRLEDLPRFAQIRAFARGQHPDLALGQVWEDVSGTDSDEFGNRQISIVGMNDDGTVQIKHVTYNGLGAQTSLGLVEIKETLDFSPDLNTLGEEWILVAMIVPLTNSGHARAGYKMPAPRVLPAPPAPPKVITPPVAPNLAPSTTPVPKPLPVNLTKALAPSLQKLGSYALR